MRCYSSRLPINKSDLLIIPGKLLDTYEYEDITPEVALTIINNHRLVKYSRTMYAAIDEDGDISCILSIRNPNCKVAYSNNYTLNEVKRSSIIKMSRKDTKERFVRRTTILPSEVQYLSLDADKFLNDDIAVFRFKVRSYDVTIEVDGVRTYLKRHIDKNKPIYPQVRKYLSQVIDSKNVRVNCTCPDFRYRFAYTATVKNFKSGDPETRPSKITNPNKKGSSCKHILYLLNNKRWTVKYVSMIDLLIRLNPDILRRSK